MICIFQSFNLFPASDSDGNNWIIPITISYPELPGSEITTVWLKENSAPLEMEARPYLLNYGAAGYYRVDYDEENWKALTQSLKTKKHINRLNRAQLINDVMNLARSSHVSYDTALDLLLYLRLEDDYVPWEAAFNALEFVDSRMDASK